jgi:hypothetical protein
MFRQVADTVSDDMSPPTVRKMKSGGDMGWGGPTGSEKRVKNIWAQETVSKGKVRRRNCVWRLLMGNRAREGHIARAK